MAPDSCFCTLLCQRYLFVLDQSDPSRICNLMFTNVVGSVGNSCNTKNARLFLLCMIKQLEIYFGKSRNSW